MTNEEICQILDISKEELNNILINNNDNNEKQ